MAKQKFKKVPDEVMCEALGHITLGNRLIKPGEFFPLPKEKAEMLQMSGLINILSEEISEGELNNGSDE
jgi:hypothetical protein